MEERLRRLADFDSLTGVRNRRQFERDLFLQVGNCQRYGEEAALLMIDLDDFKQVNDTYGHRVGDDMLKAVAQRSESARVRPISSRVWVGMSSLSCCRTSPRPRPRPWPKI